MIINLIPVIWLTQGTAPLALAVQGDVLSVNGQLFDLSVIPDGSTLPDAGKASGCLYLTGNIERTGGELHVTLRMPVSDNPTPAQAYPEPLRITADGPVHLPADDPDNDGLTATQIWEARNAD